MSYKTVKGDKATAWKNKSANTRRNRNHWQPAIAALPNEQPHRITNTATSNGPYLCPTITTLLALAQQIQHHNANPANG